MTVPERTAERDAVCEKAICARKAHAKAAIASTKNKVAVFRGKISSMKSKAICPSYLQRLQVRDQVIHFVRIKSVLESRHIRPALQNKISQNFHLIESSGLKLSAETWANDGWRSKFKFSGQMANGAAL